MKSATPHLFCTIFMDTAAERAGSVYKLAQLTAIDESNLRKLRSGKRALTLHQILKIADAVHLDKFRTVDAWARFEWELMRMIDKQNAILNQPP
jgi:DNA-binding Xre family transcriptional regulator